MPGLDEILPYLQSGGVFGGVSVVVAVSVWLSRLQTSTMDRVVADRTKASDDAVKVHSDASMAAIEIYKAAAEAAEHRAEAAEARLERVIAWTNGRYRRGVEDTGLTIDDEPL